MQKKQNVPPLAVWFLTVVFLLSTFDVPHVFAADPVDLNTPFQPFVKTLDTPEKDFSEDEIPSGSLNFQGLSLEPVSLTTLPPETKVEARGYNEQESRSHVPGFVTLKPGEDAHFSYRYYIGTGAGAVVDVTLMNADQVIDLSGGFKFRLKRTNFNSESDGVEAMSVVFIDANGAEIERRIQLDSDFQNYQLDLDEEGFDHASVQQIVFRQHFEDLDPGRAVQDRWGEIFVETGGVYLPSSVNGSLYNASELSVLSEKPSLTGSGFIRNTGSVPGFITVLNEDQTAEGFRAFRYDVGGSTGATVRAELLPKSPAVDLGDEFVLAMKNSGNGARVKVIAEDANGKFKEFILNLTDTFQNFYLNLTDIAASGFDSSRISRLMIEIDRPLSPERWGRIDFSVLYEQETQNDPFQTLKPALDNVVTDEEGTDRIFFTGIENAAAHEIQIARDAAFTDILHQAVTVVSPVSLKLVPEDGTFYFRVRGIKEFPVNTSVRSLWSDTFMYNKADAEVTLQPSSTLTAQEMTVLPQTFVGPLQVLSFSSGEGASDQAQILERGVKLTLDTGVSGFAGGGFIYPESADLSFNNFADFEPLTNLVFGIQGEVSKVKFEIVDADDNRASVQLGGIVPGVEKFWSIPLDLFSGLNLNKVRALYFIAEGGQKAGEIIVNRIRPDFVIAPDFNLNADDLTRLPDGQSGGEVSVTTVGGGNEGVFASIQKTRGGMIFDYETASQGWMAGGFIYGPHPTGAFVPGSLEGLSELVFGIQGDHDSVRLEIQDVQTANKVVIPFSGISASEERFFRIPIEFLESLDRDHLITLFFIVEGTDLSGQLIVNHEKYTVDPGLAPDPSLSSADITVFPEGSAGALLSAAIAPDGAASTADLQGGTVLINYDTGLAGWAGGGFSYDNFGDGAIQVGDLRNLNELVLGIQGVSSSLKLEVIDEAGNKAEIFLEGVQSDVEKYWRIPVSALSSIDLAQVRLIYFLVEGSNKSGQMKVRYQPSLVPLQPTPGLETADLDGPPTFGLQGPASFIALKPEGAVDSSFVVDPHGVIFSYGTGEAGWAGFGYSYEGPEPSELDTADFSGRENFVIGLMGDVPEMVLEVTDNEGRRVKLKLAGILPNEEKFFVIPLKLLESLNLFAIRNFFLIVEGLHSTGTVVIHTHPRPDFILPDLSVVLQELPGLPGNPFITAVSPETDGAFAEAQASDRGVHLSLTTGQPGWSGGGFSYDDFGTPAVEFFDVSAYSELFFGIHKTGLPERLKFELVTANGQSQSIGIQGIEDQNEHVWRVPLALFDEIDLTQLRLIYFIVEGPELEGELYVNHLPAPPVIGPSAGLTAEDITDFSSGILQSLDLTFVGDVLPVEGASVSFGDQPRGVHFNFNTGAPGGLKGRIESVQTRAADGITVIQIEAIPGVSFYQIEIARDAAFKDLVHTGFPGGTLESLNLEINGDYFVRVKGFGSGVAGVGFITDWSDGVAFTRLTGELDPFTQLQPVINSLQVNDNDGSGFLEFTPLAGAVVYQVQIARDSAFTDIVHQGFPTAGLDIFQLLKSGAYYLRVRGSKNSQIETGPASQWSEIYSFNAALAFEDPDEEEPEEPAFEPYRLPGTEGWAVTAIDFDDASTGDVLETADFSSLAQLVFGIQGDGGNVRFVIEDVSGKRGFADLTGILPETEQIWALPLSLFHELDLSRIRRVLLVVQGDQLAGSLDFLLHKE